MIVDEMHNEHPELLKDQYWEVKVPDELPYTVGSEQYRRIEPKGSAENYKIKTTDAMYANIGVKRSSHHLEDAYADYVSDYGAGNVWYQIFILICTARFVSQESVDTPLPERRRNWLSRQITRIGSIRSSSTAYSSGLYNKHPRKNSVYSSPEPVGLPPNAQHQQLHQQLQPQQLLAGPPSHKMSLTKKARQMLKSCRCPDQTKPFN